MWGIKLRGLTKPVDKDNNNSAGVCGVQEKLENGKSLERESGNRKEEEKG